MQRSLLVISSLAGVIAVAGVIWLVRGSGPGDGSTTPDTHRESAKAAKNRDVAPSANRERPRVAGADEGTPRLRPSLDKQPTASDDFDLEPHNPSFAAEKEAEVKQALGEALGAMQHGESVDVDGPDCRSRRCRFRLTVNAPAKVPELLASLERNPLRQVATQMQLGNFVNEPGKPAQVTVTLTMDSSSGEGGGD